ncbi:MAG: phosphopantetheine-binding protein [Proteobacteria bacterium]|nr:phosphopantetheine-binding protein [Pseudomonadota bacterium]
MSTTFEKIQEIVSEALYCDIEQVKRDANLMNDLGAESIDFLDIVFRLEKTFAIKLPKGDIETKARGDLAEGEFEVHGVLQEKGLARLKSMMPEVPEDRFKAGLKVKEIASLFTVATFERMVLERLNQATGVLQTPSSEAFTPATV